MKSEMVKELRASKNDIGSRAGLAMMTLVLLLAFALGANGLNRDMIAEDEMNTIANMGGFDSPYSPAQIVDSLMTHSPNHVPLYFFLGAGWAQIAGWSQVSLRLISCFFGVLMIAWLYRFAADAVNRRTAVVAALLMSTSAFVIMYWHEIRMYTMWLCLGIAHSWLYWRLAHRFRITRLTWILFTLTAVALLYTHNFSIILFIGLGAYHLLFISKSRRWLNIILAWGLGAVSILPYAPFVIDGLSYIRQGSIKTTVPASRIAEELAHLLVNHFDLLWTALILSFGYALYRKRNHTVMRLLIVAMIMCLSLLIINELFKIIRIPRMRYFLVLWFLFVILSAYGLTSMPRWPLVAGLFLLLWGIAGLQLERSIDIGNIHFVARRNRYLTRYPPLHDYADSLNNKTSERDYLIGFTEHWNINQDRKQGWSHVDYYMNVSLGIEGMFIWPEKRGDELESDVRNILDEYPYALLAHDPSDVPVNYAETLGIIQEGYIPCAVLVDKPDLLIQRYVHSAMGCDYESGG